MKCKKRFAKSEDIILKNLVSKYGAKRWDKIAKEMPARTGRQCRDRYVNYLSPDVKKSKWTTHEDRILMEMYQSLGPKWSKIAANFKGRTSSSIKNRWNFTIGRYRPDSSMSQISNLEKYTNRSKKNELISESYSTDSSDETMSDQTDNQSIMIVGQTTSQKNCLFDAVVNLVFQNEEDDQITIESPKEEEGETDETNETDETDETDELDKPMIIKKISAENIEMAKNNERQEQNRDISIFGSGVLDTMAQWDEICEIFNT